MIYRNTPQTAAVLEVIKECKHTSNKEIGKRIKDSLNLSSTTIHRITTRLVEEGLISYGPSICNVKVLDINTSEHHHFYCKKCNKLVDIKLSEDAIDHIQEQLPGRVQRQSITISGVCDKCIK